MEVDSMHFTIERKIRNTKINIPADYVLICKNACIKNPYSVEYLSFEFFKSFSNILFCKSIRPGNKKGDTAVTAIKSLMYKPYKTIFYKLRFTESCCDVPLPRETNKQNVVSFDTLPPLHKQKVKIKKYKFVHLQQLKISVEKDFHLFYNYLPKG